MKPVLPRFSLVILISVVCQGDIVNQQTSVSDIGEWTTHFANPSLPAHRIQTTIYYPQEQSEPLPLIVFGHCHLCNKNWYPYLWKYIVPRGFVMAFIGTYEHMWNNGSVPQFAFDELTVLDGVIRENSTHNGRLKGRIKNTIFCVAGHSEGGAGAFFTVSDRLPSLNGTFEHRFGAVVTLSGAKNDYDVINLFGSIHVPIFLITGSSDCLCKPSFSKAGYEHLTANHGCKGLFIISNATHCHFTQLSPFRDKKCGQVELEHCLNPTYHPAIDLSVQFDLTNEYMFLWLDGIVRRNHSALVELGRRKDDDFASGVLNYTRLDVTQC